MGLTKILLALGILLGALPSTHARSLAPPGIVNFFVAPDGDDFREVGKRHKRKIVNDCTNKSLPCRTPQHGCEEAINKWDYAGGAVPYVRLAAGSYSSGCALGGQPLGAHTLHIVGEQDRDLQESCSLSQAEKVVVNTGPGAAFDFQDLAIVVARCMTIEGPGTAFNCRQTPASDIAYIKFGGAKPLSSALTANDACGLNLGGTIWIGNDLRTFLAVNNLSRIAVPNGRSIVATSPVTVDFFAMAYQNSVIDIRGGVTISGSPITSPRGSIVWRSGSIITNGLELPGGCKQADPSQPGGCW